jgi:hypothetical protein
MQKDMTGSIKPDALSFAVFLQNGHQVCRAGRKKGVNAGCLPLQ